MDQATPSVSRRLIRLPIRLLTDLAGLEIAILLATNIATAAEADGNRTGTSDQRVESATLPSGEVLENYTHYEFGLRGGERFNDLFLKYPAGGGVELVNSNGAFTYAANPDHSSLLARFPQPQEMVHGDQRVLIIGPYVCKRWNFSEYGRPYWYIACFERAEGMAAAYLESFNTNSATATQPSPASCLRYQIENLDLENNVLTTKRIPWHAQVDSPEFRDGFPNYLIYSARGYEGGSGFEFLWKFDLARTRAKNGRRWERPIPFRMALDYSVVDFPIQHGEDLGARTRAATLAHAGAKEVGSATLEISDQELRVVSCRYAASGTNLLVEKIQAMYGFASGPTNCFNIVWQPQDPAAWPVASLQLDEWVLVGAATFGGDLGRHKFIRLRRLKP